MDYKCLNQEHLDKMLNFYKVLYKNLKNTNIVNILYGSLAYAYFTGDENIEINDIDFIAYEKKFPEIIKLIQSQENVVCQLTDHNSLRLLKDKAKLSIHSQELALEIVNFSDNLINIEINGAKFVSLGLDDLIKFYQKGCSYDIQRKTGYTNKLNNLIAKKFENHTFFFLKPSTIERNNYNEIINFIIKNGFEIIDKKEIILSYDDIEYLYKDEYNKLIPILGTENTQKAMEINQKLYKDKKCILLLVKSQNAIQKADKLKGNTYWPINCNTESIRYIFRNKEFDNIEVPAGKIVDVPCDNIIHAPKHNEEFINVIKRWFI
ncbi:MAG: nucleoside-diphosphate kinase [Candidatus Gracilibacteria bacterium]|nr:nucleoside-diphosphate kinase [Candidatus Gracilibacteria bacterium]